MASDTTGLMFDEKIALMKLIMELREPRPIGVVGLKESRDLLAALFPQFKLIRDSDLDKALDNLALESSEPPLPRDPRE